MISRDIDKLICVEVCKECQDKQFYTLKEVAGIFQVHWKTVDTWIKAGEVKAVKIGGTVRITNEEIKRIKQEKEY